MQLGTMLSSEELHVLALAEQIGPLAAYQQLIEENNTLILSAKLKIGRQIVAERTAIHTALVHRWAKEQHERIDYDQPFAVVALGGTGRGEMTPCSDTDFAFLFDDALEDNDLLIELQRQVVHRRAFDKDYGFQCEALPFSLDEMPDLAGTSLNSFLDMRPVYDPFDLATAFRKRIRASFDPFQHFLLVCESWNEQWEKATKECERLDRFDIKNEGLRLFLAGVWTLAGPEFLHSDDIYQSLEDDRDLRAYEFLLRIRAFVHLQRVGKKQGHAVPGSHAEDVLLFEDFASFGAMLGQQASEQARFEFGNTVRSRLLSARRRVACFGRAVIQRVLNVGRSVSADSPIIYGQGGLVHEGSADCNTDSARSRAAFELLHAAQRYGVPVDPAELQTTFLNADQWLRPVPELATLFHETHGSLADTFTFLANVDRAEDQLFPGYAQFESSFDERVLQEKASLRGAMERQKMRLLENGVIQGKARLEEAISRSDLLDFSKGLNEDVEAALLGAEHLAAIRLALKTKRLPLTPDDLVAREDETLPLHVRHSSGISGIPLAEYYQPYADKCGFSAETIELVEFLVGNRRAFKVYSQIGMNDQQQVDDFAALCGNESRLRSLFVFTCVDQAEWRPAEQQPTRWWNIRELYTKAMRTLSPKAEPNVTLHLQSTGFTPDQLDVLEDFRSAFSGHYGPLAIQMGEYLTKLAADASIGSKVKLFPDNIIGIATPDYRGLAASISGALAAKEASLVQAHLFSSIRYGLALDFFHVPHLEWSAQTELSGYLAEVIANQDYIGKNTQVASFDCQYTLSEWRPGKYRLRAETAFDGYGVIHAHCYKVYHLLGGNIFGLIAHTVRGVGYASLYHGLPADMPLSEAQRIIKEKFH